MLLVITMGEAEGPFQTANLIKEEISSAVAYRPDSMTGLNRTFLLHEMRDFDDIGWWMKTALVPTIDPASSRMGGAVKIARPSAFAFATGVCQCVHQALAKVGFARVTQIKGTMVGCDGLTPNLKRFYPGFCYPPASPDTLVQLAGRVRPKNVEGSTLARYN